MSLQSGNKAIALVGFDLDILDLAKSCGLSVDGYFDVTDRGRLPYLGDDEAGARYEGATAFGLQLPAMRERLWPSYAESLRTLVSPQAHIARDVSLGAGTTVHHGAMIFPEARIERGVQIHPGVYVHHETDVGEFSTLSPRALVLGRVEIGRNVFVGAGAIVKEQVKIGDGAVIGAGAVVVKDVAAGETVAGVPARPIASR